MKSNFPRTLPRTLVTAATTLAMVVFSAQSNAGSIAGTIAYDGPTGGGGRPGNKALSLDGDGDYVRTPLRDLAGSELTIAYWFKGSVNQSVVRQQRSFGFFWIVAGYFGKHILSNDGQTTGIAAGDDITDGAWHHVAMTWKQGTVGGWVAYVDGEVASTKDSANSPIPNHAVDTFFGSANGASEFANGLIDDIAIWTRALGPNEIQAAMNAPLQGNESGLAGYWNFDDDTADDLTAAANHGTLHGDAAIVDASDLGAAGQFVIEATPQTPVNGVLCLDGVDDHVVIDSLTDLSGSEITISYWFKGSRHLSVVRQQRSFGFFWIVGGYGAQHILSNDGGTSGVSAGEGISDGTWHHVVMTWKQNSADGFASYLDGQPVASRASTNVALPNNGVPLYFGSINGLGEFTNGCVDEIAIWRRALTAAEIGADWNKPLAGDEPGLFGYWKFDDGTADDSTANAHNGRFLAGAATVEESIPGFGSRLARQTLDEPGAYLLDNATEGATYVVDAYFDLNGNDQLDDGEWCGQFSGSPLELVGDVTGVDIELYDPATVWLNIGRSGDDVVLTWPEFATGMVLTSSTDLLSAPWQIFPGETSTQDGVHSLTVTPSQSLEFFRLEKR